MKELLMLTCVCTVLFSPFPSGLLLCYCLTIQVFIYQKKRKRKTNIVLLTLNNNKCCITLLLHLCFPVKVKLVRNINSKCNFITRAWIKTRDHCGQVGRTPEAAHYVGQVFAF